MTVIAHLSDLHTNGSHDRIFRIKRAFNNVCRSPAAHLVITGDVTQSGKPEQFDLLSQLMELLNLPTTLLPGNHDGGPSTWRHALDYYFVRWLQWSIPGSLIDLGDVLVVPITTQIHNVPFDASGRVSFGQMAVLKTLAKRPPDGKVEVLAMHHGPQLSPLQPLDGLANRAEVNQVLKTMPSAQVLAGHDHRILDIGNVHTAASVAYHDDPLRLYEVKNGTLVSIYKSDKQGDYLPFESPVPDKNQIP